MADILSKPPPPFDYLDAYSWLTPTVSHGGWTLTEPSPPLSVRVWYGPHPRPQGAL
jgi:hypothetical protein